MRESSKAGTDAALLQIVNEFPLICPKIFISEARTKFPFLLTPKSFAPNYHSVISRSFEETALNFHFSVKIEIQCEIS